MFIGDGANGKSQLLNLMKLTLGELAEKVEVTLLTRKRNNANEANTEKIKLMNKRFAFLSEPEDGEKINIGLLKELTGSEEIVARGLYQASVSFVMETKLFLACNELPEIKGEDTALWRRIRVVDFPSRFVDEPKEDNEYAIDRTLPARMREDVTWKQTFMNILVEYYHKTVGEPEEVKISTLGYRANNDVIMQFVNSKCLLDKHNKTYRCFCVDLWNSYQEWVISDGMPNNIKQTEFYKRIDRLTSHDRNNKVKIEDKKSTGWYGICIKNIEDDSS
jgi:P4 family phage/plasmid primase-like protien